MPDAATSVPTTPGRVALRYPLLALSFYATLALACACLAQASLFFLDWMAFLLPATLLCLAVAYRLEGRWSLGADAANRLGIVILAASGAWIIFKLPRDEDEFLATGIPWPAGLLPNLAPLLLVLLIVKLFRSKKTSDFWVLHTIGLMMVTLGCVLAGETVFGVLLFAYFVALVWCLAFFYQRQQDLCAGQGEPASHASLFGEAGATDASRLSWRDLKLGRALRWTATVVFFGLLLFLAAPRHAGWQWVPHKLTIAAKTSLRTGLNIDGGIDLHSTGLLEISDDPAFEVTAFDKNGPKNDLPPRMRWMVDVLDYYDRGQWNHYSKWVTPVHLTWGLSSLPEPIEPADQQTGRHPSLPPEAMEDDQAYFCFKLDPLASGGLVWVETPEFDDIGLNPHLGSGPTMSCLFYRLPGTDSLFWSLKSRKRTHAYGQLLRWQQDRDTLGAHNVSKKYARFLLRQDVPARIPEFVRDLLERLPDLNEVDRRLDARGYVSPERHAKVAHALCQYLAHSGEYRYTLRLRRHQILEDPTVDFLVNAREGHCQRFAGGLTLMLRSVGIPARVALGYEGLDPQGEGRYVVRQSQAHTWVQALAPNDKGELEWLVLNPTPDLAAVDEAESWSSWLVGGLDVRPLWREMVLEYNAESQRGFLQSLASHATSGPLWASIASLAALALAGWTLLRLPRWLPRLGAVLGHGEAADRDASFYARFLLLMEKACRLKPRIGQTPLEFADDAASTCTSRGVNGAEAEAPRQFAALLYQVRFGGKVLTQLELNDADTRLASLERALLAEPADPR